MISVGQLDDEGHAILFVGGTQKVTKGVRVLARGKKIGTLYMTSSPRDTIVVADANTDTSLWHRRLGHISEKRTKMLLSKGKLSKLKSIDFDDEICVLIVLAYLPKSWEAMRMTVSNSTGKEKLKYNDIRDLILTEEIHKRDAGEFSGSVLP